MKANPRVRTSSGGIQKFFADPDSKYYGKNRLYSGDEFIEYAQQIIANAPMDIQEGEMLEIISTALACMRAIKK